MTTTTNTVPATLSCCPKCDDKYLMVTSTMNVQGAVTSRAYRCQVCGPVKPGDARETVASILGFGAVA